MLSRCLRLRLTVGLVPILAAIFAFNLGSAAWSAIVAARLTQDGAGTGVLGVLYAICEISRLPAALLLPALTVHHGARRITQVGVLMLMALPLIGLSGLHNSQLMAIFVLSALPTMAVYVGMPALVIGASKEGRDGWSLAWMGLAGGAGGAIGPSIGGFLTDAYGVAPVLMLFALGSALMLPIATFGKLPGRTAWPGWTVLASRGLPWQALLALGLASAADAGRAALVPGELVHQGQPLTGAGLLLTAGAAVAGVGFLAFGRMADKRSPRRVLGLGVAVLVIGSFASALAVGFAPAFVIATSTLGMGASGIRLGAELALMAWIGRDRMASAAALAETTVLGGRALGAPAAGSLGEAYGGAYAFSAIGTAVLLTSGVLMAWTFLKLRRTLAEAAVAVPVPVVVPVTD
ncbi:MAG: MFS transporter [Chloroflexi bacterium]|nr:MFS transporter [Chloroflexota bacterium]MBV9898116.1 MFS transporter [Chloroflexota bacterium]